MQTMQAGGGQALELLAPPRLLAICSAQCGYTNSMYKKRVHCPDQPHSGAPSEFKPTARAQLDSAHQIKWISQTGGGCSIPVLMML